jgi:hypothetical protein
MAMKIPIRTFTGIQNYTKDINNRKKVINNYRSPPVFPAGPGTRPPPYALTKPAPNLPGSSTKRAILVDGKGEVNCAPKVGHKVKGYEKKRELPKVCPCDEALG